MTNYESYIFDEPGDFVFNKMKMLAKASLTFNLRLHIEATGKAQLNNHAHVLKPKRSFHGNIDFLINLLRIVGLYIQEFNRLSYGVRIGQWELTI